MYKGILFAGLISILVGCGGGGGSSSASEDRGEEVVDPYLGVWERSCVSSNPNSPTAPEVSTFLAYFFDQDNLFLKEVLTIGRESVTLSVKLFLDDLCAEPDDLSYDLYNQVIGLENIGGEIQARDEWVSKNGYDFVRYSIPVNFIAAESFPLGLHNVDDRLYIVEPFETGVFFAVEEDYFVNFNKYYVRVQD